MSDKNALTWMVSSAINDPKSVMDTIRKDTDATTKDADDFRSDMDGNLIPASSGFM